MLHFDVSGRGNRVVLVHGFTQTGRSWTGIADVLAERNQVVRVDLPGHGRSDDQRPADLDEAGAALAAAGGLGVYVGYSMGGRIALHTALRSPGVVTGLVLVGATAGLDAEADRLERRAADHVLAEQLEANGVDAFVDRWLESPLFATLPRDRAALDDRRRNTVDGLAYALRSLGTGTQRPLWEALPALKMPVLVIAGGRDTKFAELGRRMVEAIGDNAMLEVIPGSGHSVHLERPEAFLSVVRPFLRLLGQAHDPGRHDSARDPAKSTP